MPGKKINAFIAGIGAYLPDPVLTNHDLSAKVSISDKWIYAMTGIRERRIAEPAQAASDLGAAAAERAIIDAGIKPADVDLIVLASSTHDHVGTATACVVQERLGLKNTPAFDVTAGCSGFIYALVAGSQFIVTGLHRTVLVIGTEVFSRITDWNDRESCILAGDGAGAVVLRPTSSGKGIISMRLGADGAGLRHLHVPAGGCRTPVNAENMANGANKVKMDGQEVFRFAMKKLPEVTEEALELAKVNKEDVALIIPHQANRRIIEAAARRMELPIDRFMVNLDRYGNTASASIPIALHEAVTRGRIKAGDVVVLTGFGAGLTWGAVVIRWQ